MEQPPEKYMLSALSPLMDALIAEKLLKHSDDDVKVGVASCLNEITRITALVPPYEDEKMRKVFQLIVSVFGDLSDTATRSYIKRINILESMAKVRYCIVMLDLEVDEMIIEMFKDFFRSARVHHPKVVMESMEAMMSLVI
ncbi:sister chromatid cohesion protein PDS5 homolog C-like [Henckelia pumila]|uniref:sister chromatid cohesion protein PDS5 homolog C-like n=1 Tax=Henckelia pumila TaxID=405737 RepID=UPI003C6E9119